MFLYNGFRLGVRRAMAHTLTGWSLCYTSRADSTVEIAAGLQPTDACSAMTETLASYLGQVILTVRLGQ